tara:strand:- start:1091 stop:1966 length:876 start_codon:yes stop_codon:yes gene_type:complete
MATQEQIQKHSEIIDEVLDGFDDYMDSATKVLENRIAERILETKTKDELLGLRVVINDDFEELISLRVREYMKEFDKVALDTTKMVGDEITPLDNRVASELKAQAYQSIDESVKTGRENVNSEIVIGAIAGMGIQSIAQNSRHAISGLFIQVDDVETTLLQKKVIRLRKATNRKEDDIAKAFTALKKKFAGVNVGSSLQNTVKAGMHDKVMEFDAVFIKHRAEQAGLTKFKYTGSIIAGSRDFCIRNVGRTFTKAEAQSKWSKESWTGKKSGDPFVVRGGHNCRHFWVPVD